MKWAWLLLLVGCESFTAPPEDFGIPMEPNAVTDAAVRRASACAVGLTPIRTYAQLRFFLVPGGSFALDWTHSEGYDLAVSGLSIAGAIYVAEDRKDMEALWSHEALHAMWGLKGTTSTNHDPLFARCGLLVI